jgi:primosomal protein N' (replication factor Y) (superfamily II helicase)
MTIMASIVVNNNSKSIDREFDYIIPSNYEDILKIGMRVIVPFGNGNKSTEGYVVKISDIVPNKDIKFKYISDIIDFELQDTQFTSEMIELAYFLRESCHCTLSEAFRTIGPSGTIHKENIYLRIKNSKLKISSKHMNIIQHLQEEKFTDLKTLNKSMEHDIPRAELFKMEKLGALEIKIEMEKNVNIKTIDEYEINNKSLCMQFIENPPARLNKQALVLRGIMEEANSLNQAEICSKFSCSVGIIKALEDKNLIIKVKKELYRNPFNKSYSYGKFELTEDQRLAIQNILKCYSNGKNISLIHGVTGCGKTEIYLNLIEQFMKDGFGAIVLVPEISLTPQTVERFKGRFGEVVAVLHSRLSEGEKFDEWRRIKNGDVKVVVGARSAIFAPIHNLKVIIIDEEHEYSYKSEVSPKYVTSEIAIHRAEYNKGLLILGSATPSIESYHKASIGLYNLVEIKKRVENISMPTVKIIDMRDELRNGNKSMFSMELYNSIEENIQLGNQTILFLNRRGYSTFISCRACGYICKCNNCDVSLTYHIGNDRLSCHFCGTITRTPKICPVCGSKYIKHFGAGTEKIQEEIKKCFPSARVLRMDMDTTRKKGEHERIYNEFKDNKADILIGTQMISKGMDFKNVTLVGVIAADTSLNIPDFRSSERTFQLLTQVSGRAGRGEKEGKVIVQTYEPEHYSVIFASRHDYKSFYNKEIEIREFLNNPPFSDIIYVLLTSEIEAELIKYSMTLKNAFSSYGSNIKVEVLGPTPCHITKIKNNYRFHMIFKGNVSSIFNEIYNKISKTLENSKINFGFDINPISMI